MEHERSSLHHSMPSPLAPNPIRVQPCVRDKSLHRRYTAIETIVSGTVRINHEYPCIELYLWNRNSLYGTICM